jgi:4-hydroxyphenylpyruvate dioxygenase-like putative hemolysin
VADIASLNQEIRCVCGCWGRLVAVGIRRLDHVQLAMPAGREAEAVAFYEGLLGIPHVPSRIISRFAVAAGSRTEI